MTKQLREVPAPDGTRLRWNPNEAYSAERLNESTGVWYVAHPSYVLDHRTLYDDLRANPYVEAPKDAVVEAIKKWINSDEHLPTLAATLRPLIRAEVLAGLTVEECVKALVGLGSHIGLREGYPGRIVVYPPITYLHTWDGAK